MPIASSVLKKRKAIQSSSTNVSDIESLKAYAASKGLEVKEKKPSIFVRMMDYMQRPLYASAGVAKALVKGNENPLTEAWKGLKGEEKETYSDVLKEAGIENKFTRAIAGFGLDIALDPTTYVGGSLVKGVGKVAKTGGQAALETTRFFNPRLAASVEVAGKGLKDALGNAFVYGYGTTGKLSDDVSKYYNKLGMATDEAVSKFDDAFKTLPRDQHTEFARTLLDFRKQLPEMSKELGSREAAKEALNKMTPKFATEEQANFFQNTYKKLVDDMASQAGLPEAQRFEAYFPSIDVDRVKAIYPGRAVSLSDESYKKLYKGLVEKELDKPIEALTRTQTKIFRDNLAKETLDDAVKTYGISKEAFEKMADDVFLEKYGVPKSAYKMIKDKQFGKEVGYLKEADFNFINNYLHPEMKAIDLLAKNSGYDAFNKTFKTAVTSWFPAFHIRNAASGMIQNYQVLGAAAFNPNNIPTALAIMKGADRDIKLGGKIFSAKGLQKILNENFGQTSRYVADLGNYIEELTEGGYKVMSKMNPRRIGDFIETNQKANAMVAALRKGESIENAVKLAEKAGFNYQKLTKFESKVMKRLIPFYAFMRKNAELQARTLAKHPDRILNQAKLAKAFSNMFGEDISEKDLEGVPPWALEGLGFKLGKNKYVASFGVPLEEFVNRINDPIMSTLSSMTPLIKYPLESKMGYDFFRERKIIDLNKIAPATGELLMDAKDSGKLPEWLTQAININSYVKKDGTTQYTMSPKALHLLRNIPTSRFQNTFEKVFDKDLDKANKYAALFTGGKIYDIDIEQQQYFKERDLRRDIEDWLLNTGYGKKFEKFYVPNNK